MPGAGLTSYNFTTTILIDVSNRLPIALSTSFPSYPRFSVKCNDSLQQYIAAGFLIFLPTPLSLHLHKIGLETALFLVFAFNYSSPAPSPVFLPLKRICSVKFIKRGVCVSVLLTGSLAKQCRVQCVLVVVAIRSGGSGDGGEGGGGRKLKYGGEKTEG